MVPLLIADQAWDLKNIPPKSIVVAFTRKDALQLKYLLQRQGRNVSVIYGALPPEVRLRQAHRFAYGETELCVATDAIGMGLNLPADNVVFTDLTKFDGFQMRRLKAGELQQIAGRAGRYGLSERGYVGAIDRPMLDMVRRLMTQSVPDEQYARLAPRPDEIELLQGDLVQRLLIWRELNAIPEVLRSIIKSTDLEDRLDLAQFLSYDDLMHLGVERALLLINAPARKESREYWIECATAILSDRALPLPPSPPKDIDAGPSLKEAEMCIACMEIYLWLGYRQPFAHLAHDLEGTMIQRDALTREIDVALLRKFDPEIGGRQGGRPRPAKSSSGAPRENGHRPPPNEKPRRGGTSSGQGRPRGGRR
jgi:ATP-dependent RNA helicase SUPV3L1/SUV3